MPARPKRPLAERLLGSWVRELDAATLRIDAMAALLAAVLVLPQAIAFAALAGLPPAWGLNAAIVCGFVASLVGSSRHVLTGPTNALSLALAASLAPLAAAGSADYLRLALVVTLLIGVVQTAIALLRLGVLADFVSPSVLLGFTSGAALLIAWQGVKSALGWPQSQHVFSLHWPAVDLVSLAAGALTLVLSLGLRQFWPRGPHMLLALAGGTLAGVFIDGGHALARVGALPSAWPTWQWPGLQWREIGRLLPIAFALTIVALGQSMAIAKALAAKSGQLLDVNRECLGQGVANIAGACFSGFASCGSLNRSMPNLEAGARTPLAGLISAPLLLAIVALAAPWIAWIPNAAIGALLVVVAWTLIDRAQWRALARIDRRELAIAGGTAAATLVLPMEQAVMLGVAASLVAYLYRTSRPALRTMGFGAPPADGRARRLVVISPGEPECPQLKMLRVEGSVWFGAVAQVAEGLRAVRAGPRPPPHLLVMSKSMNFIDAAGAAMWEQERRARADLGGGLYFHRPRPEVLAMWKKTGFIERLGAGHLFADKATAIATIVPRLDPAVCAQCRARVFEECARQPGPPAELPADPPPGPQAES